MISERIEKNTILTICVLGAFFPGFLMSGLNVALPSISTELGMNAVMLPWVTISFTLGSGIFLVPFGKLADMYGLKKVLVIGTGIFSFSSLGVFCFNSGLMLIAVRGLHGIGASMVAITSIAILTNVFPDRERGKALGIATASLYAGTSMGPFFGGVLSQSFGWRSIFLATIIIGVVLIILALALIRKEWAHGRSRKFDVQGTIIFAAAMLVLTYGLSLIPRWNSLWLIMTSLLIFTGFIFWETKSPNPIMQVGLLRRNSYYARSNVTSMLNYSATLACSFMLSLYLQYGKGLSPIQAGLILVSSPVVQSILSPFAGRLSDRIQPRLLVSAGLLLNSTALAMFAFLDSSSSLGILLAGQIIMGFGFALFNSPNTNAIMGSVDRKYHGEASAMVSMMRNTGAMIAMSVATLVIALYIGEVTITPRYYPAFIRAMHVVFYISAAFCFGGVILSYFRGTQVRTAAEPGEVR